MQLTKVYLEKRLQEYKNAAEQHLRDSIANSGAISALEQLLKDLSMEEVGGDSGEKGKVNH